MPEGTVGSSRSWTIPVGAWAAGASSQPWTAGPPERFSARRKCGMPAAAYRCGPAFPVAHL
mgnify:CR=1 FL=1